MNTDACGKVPKQVDVPPLSLGDIIWGSLMRDNPADIFMSNISGIAGSCILLKSHMFGSLERARSPIAEVMHLSYLISLSFSFDMTVWNYRRPFRFCSIIIWKELSTSRSVSSTHPHCAQTPVQVFLCSTEPFRDHHYKFGGVMYMFIYVNVCMYTYIYVYVYIWYIHTYLYIYTYTHTYIYIYIYRDISMLYVWYKHVISISIYRYISMLYLYLYTYIICI
jgi:hypothetical protein